MYRITFGFEEYFILVSTHWIVDVWSQFIIPSHDPWSAEVKTPRLSLGRSTVQLSVGSRSSGARWCLPRCTMLAEDANRKGLVSQQLPVDFLRQWSTSRTCNFGNRERHPLDESMTTNLHIAPPVDVLKWRVCSPSRISDQE